LREGKRKGVAKGHQSKQEGGRNKDHAPEAVHREAREGAGNSFAVPKGQSAGTRERERTL